MKIIDNIKTSYESNKRLFIVILTLILGIGLALAYYIPHVASGATGNVGITSNTIDELKFEIEPSSKVLLEVGQHNVLPDGTSPKSNITAKAILKANNKTKEVTKKYNLYLKINNNTFTYTTDKYTPEILMKIKKNGVVVNNIPGFNLKTITTADAVEEQSGFDITTSIGNFIIGEDIVIHDDFTNQDPTTDKWEFEFVFVNLKSNQSKNTGKMLDAEVLIQKDKYIPTPADIGIKEEIVTTGTGLYHHTPDLLNGAGDDSYRYAGANPNNYICIGSNTNPCPDNNMYRIIGVFENDDKKYQLKVIKNSSIGNKVWNSEVNKNTVDNKYNYWQWTESDGTVKKGDLNTYLNDTSNGFYKTLPEAIKNKIDKNAKWYIDGHNTTSITPKVMHDAEIKKDNPTTITAPIGLMYAHDYGYASSGGWDKVLYNYEPNLGTNWLGGLAEWTITRNSLYSSNAFGVTSSGCVGNDNVARGRGVRPVYYLVSNTKISDGDGTKENPYQI